MPTLSKIPEGYQPIMPYLVLAGAEKFIAFTAKVFNATEKGRHMRDEKIIMHAEIMIEGCTIMFADSTEKYQPQAAGLFIYVANADETYAKALAEGATSINPPADMPYGRSGGVKDPFGNTWWITSVI